MVPWLRCAAAALLAAAVASPLHYHEPGCFRPWMAGTATGDASIEFRTATMAMWVAVVLLGWAVWSTRTSAAGIVTAVAAVLWWYGATELSRELCRGSTPGAGVWLGWGGCAATAWSLVL